MTLLLAASASGALTLIVWVILIALVLGLGYWLLSQVLPHPWPAVIIGVLALILLLVVAADYAPD